MKIYNFEEFINEGVPGSSVDALKAQKAERSAKFIAAVKAEMEKQGLGDSIFCSTRIQINNGTLVYAVKAPKVLKEEAERIGLEKKLLPNSVYLSKKFKNDPGGSEHEKYDGGTNYRYNSPAQLYAEFLKFRMNERLYIYASGAAKIEHAASTGCSFDVSVDPAQGVEKVVAWVKRMYLKDALDSVISCTKPDVCQIPKGLRGYKLTDEQFKKVTEYFPKNDVLQKWRVEYPEVFDSLTPVIVAACMAEHRKESPSISRGHDKREDMIEIAFVPGDWRPESGITAYLMKKWNKDRVVGNVMITGYGNNIAISFSSYSNPKQYEDLIEVLKEPADLYLESALNPKAIDDIDEILHKKRGKLIGRDYGV